jgi:histidyl-tRNA synthetase
MRDFLPADVRKREYVIRVVKEVYESYGFEPLAKSSCKPKGVNPAP